MRTWCAATVGAVLSVAASFPALADTDLTGKWVGQFKSIQVEIPVLPGPFGYEGGEAKTVEGPPKFTELTLQIDIDVQQKGLASGTWNSGRFKRRFVCAQINTTMWNCVDASGRASMEVTSATEVKVCYLDNLQGAQGAGCAVMRKSAAGK
jgi:hypothetical protein